MHFNNDIWYIFSDDYDIPSDADSDISEISKVSTISVRSTQSEKPHRKFRWENLYFFLFIINYNSYVSALSVLLLNITSDSPFMLVYTHIHVETQTNHSGETIYAYYIVFAFGFFVFTTNEKY